MARALGNRRPLSILTSLREAGLGLLGTFTRRGEQPRLAAHEGTIVAQKRVTRVRAFEGAV